MARRRPTVVVVLFALLCHQLCAGVWLGGYFNGRGFLNGHEDEEDLTPRELLPNYDPDDQFEDDQHFDDLFGRVVPPLDPANLDRDLLHDRIHHGRNDYHGPRHFDPSSSDFDNHFGGEYAANPFVPTEDPFDPHNPDLNILRTVLRDIDNFHANEVKNQQVSPRHGSLFSDGETVQLMAEESNSTQYPPCYLMPKSRQPSNPGISTRLIRGMMPPLSPPTGMGRGSDELDDGGDIENLSNLLDIANQMYGFDLHRLLDENNDQSSESGDGNQRYNVKRDTIPVIHRRKRSPQPRRSSSSSSRSRSSSSSSRRTTSSSSGSSGSSGSSSSGSRWSPSSSGSSSSGSSSSSSSSSGSRSDSSSRRVSTGTAVVGGAAVAGAGIGVATSGASKPKPSAPTLESTPTSGYGSGGSSSGSPYPTSGGTASAPYPTAGRPTAGSPYPTSGSPYPTAGAPYPTAGAPYPTTGGRPTAGAPYPTAGAPYPTAGAPYPTVGSPYPTAGAPYPTGGAQYPTASAPYPTSGIRPTAGSPYPTAGVPYPPGRGYPTASAPYPSSPGYGYPNAAYPNSGTRYPTSATHYPGVNAYPGASYPGSNYGSNRYSGLGGPTHGNFPQPKKSKAKKVKQVVMAAIAGYAIHKATKKARKGLFSPSIFSHRRSYSHGSSFGHGFGHGSYGHGYGYGHGHGYGHGFGGSGLGMAAVGGSVAKKILGAYVKIQIAKYALKFGMEAAKIYFYHKLGYNLRDEAIEKFIRRYQNQGDQRRRFLRLRGAALNSTLPFNITLGEDCARTCRDNDARLCLFTFKVHLYQTLTRACYDCPRNLTDCLRPECIFGAGERRLLTVVNRQLPGPAIEVCHDDRVLVEVQNDLPSAGVTLHWHGLTMDDDPYMDGVGGLTQCPIQPRETFTYSFKASFPGTHYWHAQDGLLRGEGLFGPLIVRKPDIYEPNKFFYDHDLSAHILTISDLPSRTSEAQFAERFFNEDTPPATNLLINGRAGTREGSKATLPYARIDVEKDKRYRIRVINAASLNCPVRLVAPGRHNFTVIAADGANIAAFYTHSLVIYNGERWDVVLTTDQEPGRYWLTVLGELECKGRSQYVVLSYKDHVPDPLMEADNATSNAAVGAAGNSTGRPGSSPNVTLTKEEILNAIEDTELPTEEPITEDNSVLRANTFEEDCNSPNVTCLDEMRSLMYAPLPAYMAEPLVEDTIFLGFGAQPLYNSHFYSLLYYGPEFMPPEKRSKTPQVNNLSLRLPAKPLLLDRNPPERAFCSSAGVRKKHCVGDYCECLHRQEIKHGRVVELVLVNEGLKNETLPQPVHLHGYRFWVLSQVVYDANDTTNATSENVDTNSPAGAPTNTSSDEEEEEATLPESPDSDGFTRLKALNLFSRDQLKRNFFHPIMKDTIMIPPGGYAIVRFHAQNRGYWLGESQVLLQAAGGQAFVLQVGNRTVLPRAPQGFPTC